MRQFMGLLILTLLFTITFQNPQPVSACSGGRPPGAFPLDYFLDMQTTVAGRIRTLSDSRINAVLDIDYYLQGGGDNQYLLLSQEPPEWITLSASGRPYPIRCAGLSAPLKPEQLFIAGLSRTENGSYAGYFLFPDADGRFAITLPTQPPGTLSLTYEEAITILPTALIKHRVHLPRMHSRAPSRFGWSLRRATPTTCLSIRIPPRLSRRRLNPSPHAAPGLVTTVWVACARQTASIPPTSIPLEAALRAF
jgi:hypothetical protein